MSAQISDKTSRFDVFLQLRAIQLRSNIVPRARAQYTYIYLYIYKPVAKRKIGCRNSIFVNSVRSRRDMMYFQTVSYSPRCSCCCCMFFKKHYIYMYICAKLCPCVTHANPMIAHILWKSPSLINYLSIVHCYQARVCIYRILNAQYITECIINKVVDCLIVDTHTHTQQ